MEASQRAGLNRQVAERTAQLRESEERYRNLAESTPAILWVADAQGVTRDQSSKWAEYTGQPPERALGDGWKDVVHPDDVQGVSERWSYSVRTGENYAVEYRIRRASDGAYRWHSVEAVLRKDKHGLPVGWFGACVDIEERKQAGERLRESESKYRSLFENMTEEVHLWQLVRDKGGQIETWRLVDANPPTLKTWGKTLAEIQGKTTDEIFGSGATAHYMPAVQKIMTEGVPQTFEDYFPNLDKHFRFTSVPMGEYFITTGADISEIRKAELALRESEERLRFALKSAQAAAWQWNIQTNEQIWSPESYVLHGRDPKLGRPRSKTGCTACTRMTGSPPEGQP